MLFVKKGASGRLFLCLYCLLATLPAISAPACPQADSNETATVKYIHDGDTLQLKDGRKIRLIGINTPELAHGNRAAEVFAAEAKTALTALFKNNKHLSLVYGEEKFDKYKRTLAHVFTADGRNAQQELLVQGYARAITFPPNSKYSACYLQREREARCDKKGLWKNNKVLPVKKLNDTRIGFQLVKGKVKSININRKGIWLNLDNKLTVGIRPENQPLFDINTLYKMLHQKIVVRGWLNKSKKVSSKFAPYYIRVRHPSSFELASAFTCNQ